MESRGPGPFKSLLGNLILDYLGYKQGATVNSDVPELAQIPMVTALRRKTGAVILFLGARETGNTTEMLRIAEIIGRPTYGVFPEQKPPSWVTELKFSELAKEPPPFSTLILDDLPVYMNSRSYMDKAVQVVEQMIPVVRHRRKLIMMFRAQTSGQADRHAMDADLVSFKIANPLWIDSSRPGVTRVYKDIDPEFRKMSEHQQLTHCYLIGRAWQGWARIDLPHGM